MPGTETSPSAADRALLRAARAWEIPEDDGAWRRFAPDWLDRLRAARPSSARATPEAALRQLRRDHEASARPDPDRIHPSWFVRALVDESPSVRRAVAAHAPPAIGRALRLGLGLDAGAIREDHPPDPDALGWALTLWAERLVGDVPDRGNDPPVIVAMTRLRPRDLARLVKASGQVKHAFAIVGKGPTAADEATVRMSDPDRVRLAFFRRLIGAADPRLVPAARADLGSIGGESRRGHSRLGLLTFGRLLGSAEPHRARWAMQHVPYPVVKQMKQKGTPPMPPRALATWESWVLEAAWARLLAEGRLAGARGGPS